MIKTFSSLNKTHCQKGLSLKVPYFVTEVIFGQKCIHFLQQNAYKYVIFGITPKQNVMGTLIFVI